jgi:hypothetical protein
MHVNFIPPPFHKGQSYTSHLNAELQRQKTHSISTSHFQTTDKQTQKEIARKNDRDDSHPFSTSNLNPKSTEMNRFDEIKDGEHYNRSLLSEERRMKDNIINSRNHSEPTLFSALDFSGSESFTSAPSTNKFGSGYCDLENYFNEKNESESESDKEDEDSLFDGMEDGDWNGRYQEMVTALNKSHLVSLFFHYVSGSVVKESER